MNSPSPPFNPPTLYPEAVVTCTPSHVAPPRIDKLSSTYQPAPPAVQRAGSDDHTHLPSLRQGQRVPFTPGYVFD